MPIYQWLRFEFFENSRYNDQIAIFGQKMQKNYKI